MHCTSPFDLNNHQAYAQWREVKLASHPKQAADLIVDVQNPMHLSKSERLILLRRCASANMAIYRSPVVTQDKEIPRLLAAQLGLNKLDCNWLADEDGISPIAVAPQITTTADAAEGKAARAAMIPYTNRAIKWHTDGYYHPHERNICGMVLHCVRAAKTGGETAVIDHDMAYMALRDANPDWVRALMAADAMTIPARDDEAGEARAAQTGPVFSVDAHSGALHMRYTARTRSILWKDDDSTRAAVAFLAQFLASDTPYIFRLTLAPGMGLVCNNVLHDRTGFEDDPNSPRLLYRARFLDRVGQEDVK